MSGQPETESLSRPVHVEVIATPGLDTVVVAAAVRRVAEAGGVTIELSEVAAGDVPEVDRPPAFSLPLVRIDGCCAPAAAVRLACGTYG